MTEKKTFKNPKITSYLDFIWVGWGGPYALDQGTTQFQKDEWDWEVTFTKKVKPPKVGDRALSPSGISECEIAAIDGDEVWLRYSDGSHSTIDLDKLIYAS